MIEAISTLCGNAVLMRLMRGSHQSSGLSEMSSQFHEECSTPVAAPVHRQRATVSGLWREELRLRAGDVHDRMHADRLRHDTAPASLERAQDVALGLGRAAPRPA